MIGFYTLFYKEIIRFLKVSFQTILAPVLTAILYLLIFGHVLEDKVQVYSGISYNSFLVPGLVMMSILQNAFSNPSSSLIQSKITGNIIFILLSPLSRLQVFLGYTLAGAFRGIVVGFGVLIVTVWFVKLHLYSFVWIFVFAILSAWILSIMGLIAGIVVEKFDQLAAFQNFLIMPATMLAGVFYSVKGLPSYANTLAHFNPFFYMVDGFRYGFLGDGDVDIFTNLTITILTLFILSGICIFMMKKFYKIK